MMNINKVQSWDEMKNPGDWMQTYNEGHIERGIVIVCICKEIVSLSNTVHTFESYGPLTISPSIAHMENGIMKCHYYIKDGKYIQA